IGFLRTAAMRIAWVAIAVVIALGSAGLGATLNPPPTAAGRLELTYAGDQELEPALEDATGELRRLSAQVEALSATTRQALTSLSAGEGADLQDAIARGTLELAEV